MVTASAAPARSRGGGARRVAVLLHRYVGLAIAVFVSVAGLTGSVLAYIGPLREALVPARFVAPARGNVLPLRELDAHIQAFAPGVRVAQWPLALASGTPAPFEVAGLRDASTGRERALPYDTIHLDPVSGAVLGTSNGNDGQPAAAIVLDFVYALHHSLALPGSWGTWIMGIAALLWFFDCFIGAWLTFPRGRPFLPKWKPSWQVQKRRLNFDLHRAGGLWLWGMFAVLALSSVQQNLNAEVFMPVARRLLALSPDVLGARVGSPAPAGGLRLPPDRAAEIAVRQAAARHWNDAPERMQIDEEHRVYRVVFTKPVAEWFNPTRRELYLDDRTGSVVHAFAPERSTLGDALLDWLAALHFGTALGWPYKLLLCLTGVSIVLVSVTGIVVWSRKRAGRKQTAVRRIAAAPFPSRSVQPLSKESTLRSAKS